MGCLAIGMVGAALAWMLPIAAKAAPILGQCHSCVFDIHLGLSFRLQVYQSMTNESPHEANSA